METKRNIMLERARLDAVAAWCDQNNIVPQISKLKITKPLLAGVGNYEFDLKSSQLLMPGDVALNRNDIFIPIAIGMLLTIDENTPTGKTRQYSYVPRAGVENEFGFISSELEALYNGILTQRVDQTTIMQSFPLEVFKHIGTNEPSVLLNSVDGEVSAAVQGSYDIYNMTTPMAPDITYQGTMDIATSISFNATGSNFAVAAAGSPDTPSTTHRGYISWFSIGILLKNGAEAPNLNSLSNALARAKKRA